MSRDRRAPCHMARGQDLQGDPGRLGQGEAQARFRRPPPPPGGCASARRAVPETTDPSMRSRKPEHEGVARQEAEEAARQHEPTADLESDASEQRHEDRRAGGPDGQSEEGWEARAAEGGESRLDEQTDRQGGQGVKRIAPEQQRRAGGRQPRCHEPEGLAIGRPGRVEALHRGFRRREIEVAIVDVADDLSIRRPTA